LLNHTSGLPDFDIHKEFNLRQDYTEEELVTLAARLKLNFTPGSDWNYSNTGYVLLGIIMHRVTGKPWGDFLQERIFQPLGMISTRVVSEADIIPHRAAGYDLVGGEWKHPAWVSPSLNAMADGALYFSVRDVAKWDAALYTDHPLAARIREQMWTPARFGNSATTSLKLGGASYGCAWFLDTLVGHRVVEHRGTWQGFRTFITRYVDDNLTVVVLCNLSEADPVAIAHGVARRSLSTLKGHAISDPDPAISALIADVMRSAATGTLNPERFTDEARKEQVAAWNKDLARRLKNAGGLNRLELLEFKERDGVTRLTYRATFAHETLRLTIVLNAAKIISDLKLVTD